MNVSKVNLFIVGAMKAGTTSFVEILSNHQDICVPPIKEPHFFINNLPENIYEPSRFFNLENYFNNDFPKPLHITKIKTLKQYQKLFSLSGEKKYVVDGSTCYLHAPESAEKIFNYNPKAKIIIIKREPIQRAFSHFKMDLGLGRTKTSFNTSIKKELINYKNNTLAWNSYLGMSFYNKPINRYKKLFNDVLVINFEDLIANKEVVLASTSSFLKIDDFENKKDKHKNKTRTIRFQKGLYFLKRTGVKDYFSRIFNDKFKQKVFRLISNNKTIPLKLENKAEKELNNIFTIE